MIGTCKLTGTVGPLVKSHIIPHAFMRRASGSPFKECGPEGFPRRNYVGWYDSSIVTRKGEDILEKLDDAAAKCFVEHRYTYRKRRSTSDTTMMTGGFVPREIYTIDNIDGQLIRRFGLSLLWRAAVSRLDVFSRVSLAPKRLEDLRQRIIGRILDSPDQYPVYFGVFSDGQELSKIAPYRVGSHPFIRFFLDGVVCYVSPWRKRPELQKYSFLSVGRVKDKIRIICFDRNDSNHGDYERKLANEIFEKIGDIFPNSR